MKATTKTTYNREYNEYRVRLFIDGDYQAGADYFTDCKRDAEKTAAYMVKNAVRTNKDCEIARDEQKAYEASKRGETEEVDVKEREKIIRREKDGIVITVKIFGDILRGGFEKYDAKTRGETYHCEGGLWFDGGELVDYDGVYQLGMDVGELIEELGLNADLLRH